MEAVDGWGGDNNYFIAGKEQKMTEKSADKSGPKKAKPRGKPFPKGQSGNPSGRPLGSRNRVSVLMDGILQEDAEKLMKKAIKLALDGDSSVMRSLIDRLCPPMKDRPVGVKLPAMEEAGDLPKMTAALLSALAGGELTPLEAVAISKMVEAHRSALELVDIETRISAVEQKMKETEK